MFQRIFAAIAALFMVLAGASVAKASPTHASFTGANPYGAYEIPGSANGYAIVDGMSGPFSNPNSPYNGFEMVQTVNAAGQPDWTILIYGANNTVNFDFGPNSDVGTGITYVNYSFYVPDQNGNLTRSYNLTSKSNSLCYISGEFGVSGTIGSEAGVWYSYNGIPDSDWMAVLSTPTPAQPIQLNIECMISSSNLTISAADFAVGTNSALCPGQNGSGYHCGPNFFPNFSSNLCGLTEIDTWNSGPVWAGYGPIGSIEYFEMGGPGSTTHAHASCVATH